MGGNRKRQGGPTGRDKGAQEQRSSKGECGYIRKQEKKNRDAERIAVPADEKSPRDDYT